VADKAGDLIAAGFPQGSYLAEFSRVALHQSRIKVVLANEKTESITQPGLAVIVDSGRQLRGSFYG
jgi:hypothetical protein